MQRTNNEKITEAYDTSNASKAEVSRSNSIGIQNENGCSKEISMSLDGGARQTNRNSNVEDMEDATRSAVTLYQALEKFIQRAECRTDLSENFKSALSKHLSSIRKWRKDLEKTDHGIVVAGETSSGKSTLINKIIGKKLFKGRLFESTSTICKIRNSDQIKIITTKQTNETQEIDLSGTCNIQHKRGVRELRRFLKERTDLTYLSPDITVDFQTVEIGLPIPFLKGNTILVDTPGIGGSGKVTQKLIEYLPNALAFIFVIDVSSAGGMQKDRLPELLKKVTDLQSQSEMPCFNPKNVVFITNKWDLVKKQIESSDEDSSESDNEEEITIWEKLKMEIKQEWPLVTKENIFKMILKDVSSRNQNDSTTSFQDFQKILASLVKKAENLRVVEHLRLLPKILKEISKEIDIRKKMGEKSEEEQEQKYKENTENIDSLKKECTEVKKKYGERVKVDVGAIIEECMTYMSTKEGKYRILNPAGRVSIAETNWNKTNFEARIKSRIDLYVKHFLQSDSVVKRHQDIVREIQSFYAQTKFSINAIENESVDVHPPNDEETESFTYLIQLGLISSPVWLAALAFGFGIPAAICGGCAFVISSFFGWVSKTTKDIDDEYKKCKNTVPAIIHTHLEKHFAEPINQMVDAVSQQLLKSIKEAEKRNEDVRKEGEQLLANRKLYCKFAREVSALEKTVTSLRENFDDEGALKDRCYDSLPC